MLVEIIEVTVYADSVELVGFNLEKALQKGIYQEFTDKYNNTYRFDMTKQGHIKYLYTLLKSNKKCQQEKSFGAMCDKLNGQLLNLPDSFKA